jgi:hypothetical protein
MYIEYSPNVCRVIGSVTQYERAVLDLALKFDHPNPSRLQAENPYWDGKVNFWVDSYMTTFPTGLWPHVWNMLYSHGLTESVHVQCSIGLKTSSVQVTADIFADRGITLHDYQVTLANQAIAGNRGVISAPPRSGKTFIQAAIARALDKKTVILIQRDVLLKQHYESFKDLGFDVGMVQGSRRDFDKQVNIAMFQTVWAGQKSKEMLEWLDSVDVMMIDECHHAGSADSYFMAGLLSPASWRLGFSGTPYSVTALEDGKFSEDHWRLHGLLGPPLGEISLRYLQDEKFLVNVDIVQVKISEDPSIGELDGNCWHPVYKAGVVDNVLRNRSIVAIAKDMVDKGYFPLILVNQVGHGNELFDRLVDAGVDPVFARGGSKVRTSSGMRTGPLSSGYDMCVAGSGNVLIATQIGDEGVNLPKVDGLILAVGGKADKVNIQRVFRPLTSSEGKTHAMVIDFEDRQHNVLKRQSAARRKIFKSLGFSCKMAFLEQAIDMIPSKL